MNKGEAYKVCESYLLGRSAKSVGEEFGYSHTYIKQFVYKSINRSLISKYDVGGEKLSIDKWSAKWLRENSDAILERLYRWANNIS